MARIKIDKKIVKYAVAKPEAEPREPREDAAAPDASQSDAKVIRMHEKLERPEVLIGSTYKVKTPVSDHAMYVTINDIVLNEGTKHEQRRPFEIFINSKNLDHYQWIVALTRIMSAVFRKGGDVTFLVDELKAVFDPRGGYWQPGGKFMPSIIAELGHIVERHLIGIGLLKPPEPSPEQLKFLSEKRAEFEARGVQQDAFAEGAFPEGAQLCTKCNTAAAVMLDGCMTCLNCGYSKCG
ncbi:MAG TPA: NrdJb [Gammaproteobacteria bacterium]